MLKITIVQGAFLPVPAIMGGAVEKVWTALAGAFAVKGHQVTHISRHHDSLPDSEVKGGVNFVRIRGSNAPASLIHLKILDLIYSVRVARKLPHADILVTNTFFLPIIVRKWEVGCLYVHVARYPRGQMGLYWRADRLQTVSNFVAEAIKTQTPSLADRVKVIPYPVLAPFSSTEPPGRCAGKRILFVGRLHPEKGVDLLLRAFARLSGEVKKEWCLTIVGPSEAKYGGGGEGYLKSLLVLGEKLELDVQWIGKVFCEEKLEQIYGGAQIFVYPSLAEKGEAFGLAPLEAMAQGCVPIVSDLACFREFISDGVNGSVFDHTLVNPEIELAREILELIDSPNKREKLAIAGRRTCRGLGLDKIANRFLSDFDSIVQTKSRGRNWQPNPHGQQ